MRRLVTVVSILLLYFAFSYSATASDSYSSSGNGNWKNSSTWGLSGSKYPGREGGPDDVTVNAGHTVNKKGDGKGTLGKVTINGTLQGVSSKDDINIAAKDSVIVGKNGKVGGAESGTKKNNPVTITSGKSVVLKKGATVEGKGSKGGVKIEADDGDVSIDSASVHSEKNGIEIRSKEKSVIVKKGSVVSGAGNVRIRSGSGDSTSIDGTVNSGRGNVIINGNRKGKKASPRNPGNVRIGPNGVLRAPNGEVIIFADTLIIEGKIDSKTLQKKCKVCILIKPPGEIKARNRSKDKIIVREVVKNENPGDGGGQESDENKIIGEDHSYIDLSLSPRAVVAPVSALVATGIGGTIDLTGNFPGQYVIESSGTIELFADNILLEPGITPDMICGPGPVVWGPSEPISDVAAFSISDTVGYPGYPGELEFIIQNMGNVPDSFFVDVVDSLGWSIWWDYVDVLLDNLSPLDTTLTVYFEPPPWSIPDVDTNSLTLTVTSKSRPWIMHTERKIIPVGDEWDLMNVAILPWSVQEATAGDTILITSLIRNIGDVFPEEYDVIVTDREGWPIVPSTGPLMLFPQEDSLWVTGVVIPWGMEPTDENEVYFHVQSLGCPESWDTDTVLVYGGLVTGVEDEDRPPVYTTIAHRAYPNPFNPSVKITFTVPAGGGKTKIEIFDTAGRRVRTVFSGPLTTGKHTKTWDGTTSAGEPAASGVYYYRISVGTQRVSGKLSLLK